MSLYTIIDYSYVDGLNLSDQFLAAVLVVDALSFVVLNPDVCDVVI